MLLDELFFAHDPPFVRPCISGDKLSDKVASRCGSIVRPDGYFTSINGQISRQIFFSFLIQKKIVKTDDLFVLDYYLSEEGRSFLAYKNIISILSRRIICLSPAFVYLHYKRATWETSSWRIRKMRRETQFMYSN